MSETRMTGREAKVAERKRRMGTIARRLATQKGHDWKTLSKQDRKIFVERAGEHIKAALERATPTE